MRFGDKSPLILKCLYDHGRQGVRRIARQTGLSKSSVQRLTQAMERRGGPLEAWLWETEDGRRWLTRLVVATLC
jgi:DNA-binding IclR family transcriptional regulator